MSLVSSDEPSGERQREPGGGPRPVRAGAGGAAGDRRGRRPCRIWCRSRSRLAERAGQDVIYSVVDAKRSGRSRCDGWPTCPRIPRVSVLGDHYEEDWDRLWWVRADGRGRLLTESASPKLRRRWRCSRRATRSNGRSGRCWRSTSTRWSGWRRRPPEHWRTCAPPVRPSSVDRHARGCQVRQGSLGPARRRSRGSRPERRSPSTPRRALPARSARCRSRSPGRRR